MREPIPGESDPFMGVRTEIPDVAVTGTITAVNTRDGTVHVSLEDGGLGVRPGIQIPIFQFSYMRGTSSWFRFMPQRGDRITLVRNLNGRFHIVNYECLNYRQLANEDEGGQLLFRELKEGEYEIRSSGAAAIFGSKDGTLRLAGGPATITISRPDMSIEADATLHKVTSLACQIRFGEVRRLLLPTDLDETALAGGTQREYRLVVAKDAGVVDIPMVDVKVGDVVDDAAPFAPTIGSGGGPLRAHVRVYDAAGATVVYDLEVDALGNVEATQASTAAALGLKLVGLASSLLAQYRDFTFQPTTTIKLGGPGATENVPLGVQLSAFLQALMDALNSAVIATAMGPASFNPATLAAFAALKAAYLASNVILSDVAFTQKLSSPATP